MLHDAEVLLPHGIVAQLVFNDLFHGYFTVFGRDMAMDVLAVWAVRTVAVLMELVANLSLDFERNNFLS